MKHFWPKLKLSEAGEIRNSKSASVKLKSLKHIERWLSYKEKNHSYIISRAKLILGDPRIRGFYSNNEDSPQFWKRKCREIISNYERFPRQSSEEKEGVKNYILKIWPKYQEIIKANTSYSPKFISSTIEFLEDIVKFIEPQNNRFNIKKELIETLKGRVFQIKKGEYLCEEHFKEASEVIGNLKAKDLFIAGLDKRIEELYKKLKLPAQ